MKYREGFKYQLYEDEVFFTRIKPVEPIETYFISLATGGTLTTKRGYAWDGPSGPAFDTNTFMRASLAHDALYQLMRMGLLDFKWRPCADEEMKSICEEAGMWPWRVWWVYQGVKNFAASAAKENNRKKVLEAP